MIIVVSGGRNHPYRNFIRTVLNSVYVKHGAFSLYHGACQDKDGNLIGADKHAHEWACEVWDPRAGNLGKLVRQFPADWDNFGNGAGPKRNGEMMEAAVAAEPGEVRLLAFPSPSSRGTWNAVGHAKRLKVPFYSYTYADIRRHSEETSR